MGTPEDHWLKGIDTGIMGEPPVKLMIRTGVLADYEFRFENEWPLARTEWTKMYLKLNSSRQTESGQPEGELVAKPVKEAAHAQYAASPPTHAGVSSSAMAQQLSLSMGVAIAALVLHDSKGDGPVRATIRHSSVLLVCHSVPET